MKCILLLFIATMLFVVVSCKYQKGKSFNYNKANDTTTYLIREVAGGKKIIKKIGELRIEHKRKGDDCIIIFVNDSSDVAKNKSILLFHSELPDFSKDMLQKGFMGAFGTKQNVTYLVVTKNDFNKNFKPSVNLKK